MTDLSIEVNGIRFMNPFLLGSGPPGTNGKVIRRSFELGWGGIVCKTLSLDNNKVHNTAPRYGKLKSHTGSGEVLGFQNIELISDRPFDRWLEELDGVEAAEWRLALVERGAEDFESQQLLEASASRASGISALSAQAGDLFFACSDVSERRVRAFKLVR